MGSCASLFWLEASSALALASQGLSGPRHGSCTLCAGADCFTESGKVVPVSRSFPSVSYLGRCTYHSNIQA